MNRSPRGRAVRRYPLFTTWKLWRHLTQPPAHPLFERTIGRRIGHRATTFIAWIAPMVGLLSCCGSWTLVNQWHLPIPVFVLAPSVIFSSFYTAAWVIRITAAISWEREQRTYETFCLPPSGAAGANFAMCAATLQSDDELSWVSLSRKIVSGLLLLILLSVLQTAAGRGGILYAPPILQLLVDIVALAAISYVDHVQSVVLGSLIGMLVPFYSRSGVEGRFLALVLFLILQILTLAAALVTAIVILPNITADDNIASPILLTLLVFYLTRETFIVVLWTILANHLNVRPADWFTEQR